MELYEALSQNIKFLLIEVQKQVQRTQAHVAHPAGKILTKVQASDDYIDNLKTFVQTKCFSLAARIQPGDQTSVAKLKAFEVVAVNLERISDFCERVSEQVGYLEDVSILEDYDFDPFFEEVLTGVARLEKAVASQDVQQALQVCRSEQELDELYSKMLRRILKDLEQSGEQAQAYVTVLFISHYLERMGDSLLNGGEALLSASLGERIKFGQLRQLEDSLSEGEIESELENVAMHAVGETKSGSRIARLTTREDNRAAVIFKEGKTRKLMEERDSISRWQELVPGIAPNIISFHEEGPRSAILFEYLSGRTFEELLLRAPAAELNLALDKLCRTLNDVWLSTKRDEPAKPAFIQQLASRMDDVRAVHPELVTTGGRIGPVEIPEFAELLRECAPLDEHLECPFSVFIHGDLNIDNVIIDFDSEQVRFIDLHRSRHMDYCQDASVFLVSNFRLQVFESEVRRRIRGVMLRFCDFVLNFAKINGDRTLPMRLALGLARSFASSTRFVLDESLSREMFLRSRFMLQYVHAHREQDPAQFELPTEVLFD